MERSIFWSFELREGRVASVLFQGIESERETERERERETLDMQQRYKYDRLDRGERGEETGEWASELIGMSTAESNARTEGRGVSLSSHIVNSMEQK